MPTDNQQAEKINSFIEKASGVEGQILLNLLIARAPIFGMPGLKWLTSLVIGWLMDPITDAAELWATYRVIESQVSMETGATLTASLALLGAIRLGDPDKIKAAKEAYEKAQDALDHLDGSARPQ